MRLCVLPQNFQKLSYITMRACARVCACARIVREQGNWTVVTMNGETKSVLIFRFC
jgi:hypothetical protein